MAKAYYPVDPKWLWFDIPGYNGMYQISKEGNIRRVYSSGKVKNIISYHKKDCMKTIVRLQDGEKRKEHSVISLMAKTFFNQPPGTVCYHKNGVISDNSVSNIGFTSRRTLGKKTGHMSNRKCVFKIDRRHNVVAVYRSAREAGRKNHMSYQAVLDRCNGKIKNPFALDGYNYIFEERRN